MSYSTVDSLMPPPQPPAGKAIFSISTGIRLPGKGSIVSFPRVNFYGDWGYLKMKEEKDTLKKKKKTIPTDESMLKGALGNEKELPMARTGTI